MKKQALKNLNVLRKKKEVKKVTLQQVSSTRDMIFLGTAREVGTVENLAKTKHDNRRVGCGKLVAWEMHEKIRGKTPHWTNNGDEKSAINYTPGGNCEKQHNKNINCANSTKNTDHIIVSKKYSSRRTSNKKNKEKDKMKRMEQQIADSIRNFVAPVDAEDNSSLNRTPKILETLKLMKQKQRRRRKGCKKSTKAFKQNNKVTKILKKKQKSPTTKTSEKQKKQPKIAAAKTSEKPQPQVLGGNDVKQECKTPKTETNVHYKNVQVPENVRKAWDTLDRLDEPNQISPFQGFFSYSNSDAVGLVSDNVQIDIVSLLKDFVANERVEVEVA